MDETFINAVFQKKSSKSETKADLTTQISRQIVDTERDLRNAKTERLRLARLEQEMKLSAANKITATENSQTKKGKNHAGSGTR